MGTFEGSLTTSSGPSTYPLTLAEVKDHLEVDYDYHDYLIQAQLSAAVDMVESETNRDICERTRVWKFDDLCGDVLLLPVGPVQSVTSIQYVDTDGNTQTYSSGNYSLDTGRLPNLIRLGYNQSWPTVRGGPNDVTITFVTGYAGTADSPINLFGIPDAIKAALKLLVGDMYKDRESGVTGTIYTKLPTVERLLAPYRIYYQ